MLLPEEFIIRTQSLLGNEWEAFERSLREDTPVSIRLNPRKPTKIEPDQFFPGVFRKKEIPWATNAYYLSERPVFTLDPLFHAGVYYVQEASSMYLEQILTDRFSGPVKALDLCAAPGGKSTHLSALLPEGSLLLANEVISSRSRILAENLIKWGNPHTIVTNNDPKEIGGLSGFFDLVLADVPCSGEGMFRKDPAAINEWSTANVRLCAERQRRIIADVWPALKPGGILVYSTCTYNKEENEENIFWICSELGGKILNEPHRFFPHQTTGEGFFITALQKDESIAGKERKNSGRKKEANNPVPTDLQQAGKWLKNYDEFGLFTEHSRLRAFPKKDLDAFQEIQSCLRIVSSGVLLGEIKGKDLIPHHSLALSTALSETAFPACEVDKKTALRYLRKETVLDLPDSLPKGYILLTYGNIPLGFIKNIGNRFNNLYPAEWRIKMNID